MIFPSEFPSHRKNEHGEKIVFDALKKLSDDLAVFYHVPINLPTKEGGLREAEFDFLVADLRE